MWNRRRTARTSAIAVMAPLAVAALLLTGCESDSSDKKDAPAGAGPSVVAPGKPGEAAETLSADEAKKAVDDDTPNSADFGYVQMMIKHHQQALTMTSLAKKHAGSQKVERLSDRIASAQGPEIKAMEGWIKTNGGARKSGKHDHAAMPGMATGKQLDTLRAARGADFDKLFLKLMITHHTGAISMATEVLADGNNVLVEEMANDVVAQQTSEIRRMRQLS